MSGKNWSRDDVVKWLRECECEDEETAEIKPASYEPDQLLQQVTGMNGIDNASCPGTYEKVTNAICQDPAAALDAVREIMKQIGVGCPQSFAKALADVFTVSQETGIINPFSTEDL